MEHSRFGGDDDCLGVGFFAVADHFLRGANLIRQQSDGFCAFWVGDYGGVWMQAADLQNAVAGEFDVGVAVALPKRHGAVCLFGYPGAEVFVRHEEEVAVFRGGFDDFLGVAASADYVAQCFDFRAAVDVGDGVEVRVGCLEGFEFVRRAALF